MFILPFGTICINNRLSVGVEPIQHIFIREPEYDIFYLDGENQMYFQCIKELHVAPTQAYVSSPIEAHGACRSGTGLS